MQKLIAVLLALIFVACGDATGPDGLDIPDGPLQMAIVKGDSQEVAVTDTLPFDAVTQVMKGGEPMSDQLVDWVVTADNCGTPFVSTTRTDSVGTTGNRAVAGTRAWTQPDVEDFCRMEVRWALTQGDSVIADVDTAFHYLVLPGTVEGDSLSGYIFAGTDRDTIPGAFVYDQYGNPGEWWIEADCCAHAVDTTPGSVGARTLVWDSAGSGTVSVVAGDTTLISGALSTGSAGEVRADFRN